jgi:general stress protein 26
VLSEINLADVIRRFDESHYCWVGTVRPDGRSHATPIWHVWFQNKIYMVTTPWSVKVANITGNPHVSVTHPDPTHAIIFEGIARLVNAMVPALQPHFKKKYDWDIASDKEYTAVIEITPQKLMAWGDEGAGKRKRWNGGQIAGVASGG